MIRKSKMKATQIRLPERVFEGLHELRTAGYLPSAIMRQAIEKAVNERLHAIKAKE